MEPLPTGWERREVSEHIARVFMRLRDRQIEKQREGEKLAAQAAAETNER